MCLRLMRRISVAFSSTSRMRPPLITAMRSAIASASSM